MPAPGRLLAGAAAGCVATLVMSGVMLGSRRLGLVDELEPEKITDAGLSAADAHPPEGQRDALAAVAHLGFGAAMGSAFALVVPAVPASPGLAGPAFGLLVALASYQGWVPALGILPPLSDQHPARRWHLVASHLVFGAVLGRLLGDGRERPPTRRAGRARRRGR